MCAGGWPGDYSEDPFQVPVWEKRCFWLKRGVVCALVEIVQ